MLVSLRSMLQTRSPSHRVEDCTVHEGSSADDNASLLVCVVQVLVDSGFLRVQEVGRLAQVSKDLQQVTVDDHIWASFCRQHWRGTRNIPKSSLESSGYQSLYKQWSHPVVKCRPPNRLNRFFRQCSDLISKKQPMSKKQPPLGPPTCSTDEIQLHVLVKYKGVVVVCECIEGEGMERFCKRGSIGLKFGRPFTFGRAFWECSREEMQMYLDGQNEYGLNVGCPQLDLAKLEIRIHCYRTTDSTMTCLLSSDTSRQENFSLRLHPGPDETVDETRKQEPGILAIGPFKAENFAGLPLRKSRQAADIRRRFVDPIDLACYVMFKMDKRGNFGMTEIYMDVMKKPKRENVLVERFKTEEVVKHHGVSLLHILSELKGV